MNTQDVFALIERFDESSLTEMKLRDGDFRIHLKKAGSEPTVIYQSHPGHHVIPQTAAQAPVSAPVQSASESASSAGNQGAPAATAADTEQVTSPIVGTFYRSPAPDSPPHVEEGSVVKAGAGLCIIEAMKVMNELEADFDMEIVSVLVENGAMVEFGTPLFEVRRT
ncbi:acetyl-CoA carboxylase biotin carboxyl carrier protein [Spirochaeta dissipatitropha]